MKKKTYLLLVANIGLLITIMILVIQLFNTDHLSDKPYIAYRFIVKQNHVSERKFVANGYIKAVDIEEYTYNIDDIRVYNIDLDCLVSKDEVLIEFNDESKFEVKANGYISSFDHEDFIINFSITYFTRYEVSFYIDDYHLINNVKKGDLYNVRISNYNDYVNINFIDHVIGDNGLFVKAIYDNSTFNVMYEKTVEVNKSYEVNVNEMILPYEFILVTGSNKGKVRVLVNDQIILKDIEFEEVNNHYVNVTKGLSSNEELVII